MEIVVIRAGANRKLHSKSIAYYMIYSNMIQKHHIFTLWSSSSCSFSSLSRSSMSLCLKYLIRLRDACRPFWMEKQAASSLHTRWRTKHQQMKARDGELFRHSWQLCCLLTLANLSWSLHKDDVSPLGVGRDCTSNSCKAIWIEDGLLCPHESGQTAFQLQVNVLKKETRTNTNVMN